MHLVILGAGGYGRTVADVAAQSGKYDKILFLDDGSTAPDVAGKCETFEAYVSPGTEFYPAFGDSEIRLNWLDKLTQAGAVIPTILHSTAYISSTAQIRPGTVVFPHAIINTDCLVERGCIVNCGAIVDHGCVLEEGVHVCLGSIIKAENRIPRCMKIEAGEVIENRTYPL